jgi:hypothetical protein
MRRGGRGRRRWGWKRSRCRTFHVKRRPDPPAGHFTPAPTPRRSWRSWRWRWIRRPGRRSQAAGRRSGGRGGRGLPGTYAWRSATGGRRRRFRAGAGAGRPGAARAGARGVGAGAGGWCGGKGRIVRSRLLRGGRVGECGARGRDVEGRLRERGGRLIQPWFGPRIPGGLGDGVSCPRPAPLPEATLVRSMPGRPKRSTGAVVTCATTWAPCEAPSTAANRPESISRKRSPKLSPRASPTTAPLATDCPIRRGGRTPPARVRAQTECGKVGGVPPTAPRSQRCADRVPLLPRSQTLSGRAA